MITGKPLFNLPSKLYCTPCSYGLQGIAARIYYSFHRQNQSSRYGLQGIAARIYYKAWLYMADPAMVCKESLLGYTPQAMPGCRREAMVCKESLLGYTTADFLMQQFLLWFARNRCSDILCYADLRKADLLWFARNRCSDILQSGSKANRNGYGLQGIAARIYCEPGHRHRILRYGLQGIAARIYC